MRGRVASLLSFVLAGLCVATQVSAQANPAVCSDLRTRGTASYQNFPASFPGSVAWVGNPAETKNVFDETKSANFYPLFRDQCSEVDRYQIQNLKGGILHFVIDKTPALQGEEELDGAFLLVRAEAVYRGEGETRFSAYRFGSGWARDGRQIGGLQPTLASISPETWNSVHLSSDVNASDGLFNKPLHAESMLTHTSTWDYRTKLIVEPGNQARTIFVMIFLLSANSKLSTVPFKFFIDNPLRLQAVNIRLVSDIPSLNYETRLRLRD